MAGTGIFCSESEAKEVKRLHKEASTTPVMLVGSVDLSTSAWDFLTDYLEELAQKHNAPKGSGINLKTMEFVSR